MGRNNLPFAGHHADEVLTRRGYFDNSFRATSTSVPGGLVTGRIDGVPTTRFEVQADGTRTVAG